MKKQSAKDIAFEKERQHFRSEIRDLERVIRNREKDIAELIETKRSLESEIAEKDEWIDRLLGYTEMSREDVQQMIKKEKEEVELRQVVGDFLGVAKTITRLTGGTYL